VSNAGPGSVTGAQVTLSAPAGWTVAPAAGQALGTVDQGQSSAASWTVTAPSGGQPATAPLDASVTYTDAANGGPGSVTTFQGPPSRLPPTVSSLEPTAAAAGQQVTIHGANFGATRVDPSRDYVFFIDGPVSWGAPFDGATFVVNSWSDQAITFTVPTPSGPNGLWHVVPGTTADVTVFTSSGNSTTFKLKITA
jgi:hypothetical protein